MVKGIFKDQLGRDIHLDHTPERIVSLVPSQTELLSDLGCDEKVVGITKFCVHPGTWRTTKKIIGGTKAFHFDDIDNLEPDLIIGNKEENYEEGIARLSTRYPVWMSDIVSLNDAFQMIRSIGSMVDRQANAASIIDEIRTAIAKPASHGGTRVLYLIWNNPLMAAGKNTFINTMLESAGMINVIDADRYPVLETKEISALSPDVILLSTEPYPFRENHVTEIASVTRSRVMLVDGEMFTWYGSRLRLATAYIRSLAL